MTFEEVIKRALFRWWLIAIVTIVSTLLFLNWTTANSFQASIGLGISFNNANFLSEIRGQNLTSAAGQAPNRGAEYTYSLQEFSNYLLSRFSSVEIQSRIAEKIGDKHNSYNSKQPFYKVEAQSGGYISITYDAGDRISAEKFLQAAKEEFRNLVITERSKKEIDAFSIDPKNEFIENIIEIARPSQFRVLPTLAGFLIGLTVAVLLPFKKF